VRVLRYRAASVPATLAERMSPVLGGRSLALRTAREAAAASLELADVTEASRQLDARAVRALLLARRQDFHVNAKQLEELADAKVPAEVIDAMVALSYPEKFAIAPSSDVVLRPDSGQSALLDSYAYPSYGWGYDPYLGYLPYGYWPYGYGYGSGWYPGDGPIIITNPSGPRAPHGKVVNGRGYSRGDDDSADADRRGGADRGSGSTRTSSGTSAGRSGESTGRTAKPRP
jgi:hypothetical protein